MKRTCVMRNDSHSSQHDVSTVLMSSTWERTMPMAKGWQSRAVTMPHYGIDGHQIIRNVTVSDRPLRYRYADTWSHGIHPTDISMYYRSGLFVTVDYDYVLLSLHIGFDTLISTKGLSANQCEGIPTTRLSDPPAHSLASMIHTL
ncbi:hypothetical protein TMatcc_000697 [Talaromyces marneffei ATCC 18224]